MSSSFESLSGAVDLPFAEYAEPPDEPMALACRWVADARDAGVREPLALALATADGDGRTSTRIVSVLGLGPAGVTFSSHAGSRKGRQIEQTGWGSGLLYWRETGQQLSVSGPVHPLSDAVADAQWQGRPAPLHAMSVVSRQSEALADVAALRDAADRLAGRPQPRPAGYTVYLLEATHVEFWAAAGDRLHRRLRYERHGSAWRVTRLQP